MTAGWEVYFLRWYIWEDVGKLIGNTLMFA